VNLFACRLAAPLVWAAVPIFGYQWVRHPMLRAERSGSSIAEAIESIAIYLREGAQWPW
jgi:hypothetical protein